MPKDDSSTDPSSHAGGTDDRLIDAARREVEETITLRSQRLSEGPGTVIGRYKLLQLIGEGGFGVVYMAEQTEPVRRKVALKIIKLGMDTRQVITRFEAERQALAMMDHPNIAKVLDAGATDSGRPYFVMELVRGIPITAYCDQNNLNTHKRLDLFMAVCNAVQHAHQKGIIHRDIKPSNVMVTLHDGVPVPKVIDFGIAKATHQRLTEKTLFTQYGQFIGTPAYMSPEQAEMSGLDIDTRSDIYSLGVLLYELLTGTTPFDARWLLSAGHNEMLRIIREQEPHKPSTRVSSLQSEPPYKSEPKAPAPGSPTPSPSQGEGRGEGSSTPSPSKDTPAHTPSPSKGEGWGEGSSAAEIARHRRTDPASLSKQLRGDLDWIIMKALEKDRTRRYDTANGLAADLRRHLNHEPVVASPPSMAYRARKFIRRNRSLVTAATVVFLVLVAGIVSSTIFAVGQSRARQEAEAAREAEAAAREDVQKRADELKTVTQFQQSMLGDIDAEVMGRAIVNDLRERIRERMATDDASSEEIEAALASFDELMRKVNATGLAVKVVDDNVLARAVETIEKEFADQPVVEAALRQTVGETYHKLGLYQQALPQMKRALTLRRRVLGDDHPDTLSSLHAMGGLFSEMGEPAEAKSHFREAVEGRRRVLGDDHPLTLLSRGELSLVEQWTGSQETADKLMLEQLQRLFGRERGTADFQTEVEAFLLAELRKLWSSGEHDAARALIRERIAPLTNMPVWKTELFDGMGVLAMQRLEEGDLDTAEPLLLEALEGNRRVLGDDHVYTLRAIGRMGRLLWRRGKLAKAQAYYRESLEGFRRVKDDDHPETLNSIISMGYLFRRMCKYEEAMPYYREALECRRRVLGNNHPKTLTSINHMGWILWDMGKLAEAEPYYREVLKRCRRVLGDDHPKTLTSINHMGLLLQSMGKPAEAEPYFREALKGRRKALKDSRRVKGDDHPDTLSLIGNMGSLFKSMGKYAEAEPYFREALESRRRVLGDDHPDTLRSISSMGGLLESMGKYTEAEPLYREVLETRRRARPEGDAAIGSALIVLGKNLVELEKYAKAEPLLRERLELQRKTLPKDHWLIFNTMSVLGECLAGGAASSSGTPEKFTEAESLLLESHSKLNETADAIPGAVRVVRLREALERIVALYDAWHEGEPDKGYDAKAAEWRTKLAATSQPASEPAEQR